MKRKIFSLFMVSVIGASCLAGCGTGSSDDSTGSTQSSSEDGTQTSESAAGGDYEGSLEGVTLAVGCDTSFVPFCFPDDNSDYTGFDIDLLDAFSDYLGFDYELQPMDFTALLMSVQSGQTDMAMAGITITEERQEVMDISDPYYDAGLQIFAREDDDSISQISDLEGKNIALKEGTASVTYVNENVSDCTITTFPNIENAYLEVQRGTADAVVYDSPNELYYLSQNPDCGCKVVGDLVDACQYGVVLQKDSDYTEYINAALAQFHEDGTYDAIYEKWFGTEAE